MRIGNRVNMTIARARMTRVAKTRTFTAARKSSGHTSSVSGKDNSMQALIQQMLKKSEASSAEKLAENQKQSYQYEVMEKSAQNVEGRIAKLKADGEKSIFGQENQEAAQEAAVKEISGFVSDFNVMVGELGGSKNQLDSVFLRKLNDVTMRYSTELEQMGITRNSNGTLSVDQKVLQAAELSDLKKLFGPDNTFAAKIGEQAGLIKESAQRNIETLKTDSWQISQNYNRYGADSSIWGNGSRYNAKG